MIKYTNEDVFVLDLQLFDDAGTLVNATNGYTNAYTGAREEFAGEYDLSPTMKTYYHQALLKRNKLRRIYHQLGKVEVLPAGHGKISEWRKLRKMEDVSRLEEAVIPKGRKLGMTSTTVEIAQYGAYYTLSDQLNLHALDPLLDETNENLSNAAGDTYEKLIRNELMTCTNVMYAEVVADNGTIESKPQTREELMTALKAGKNASLTPRTINRATTILKKADAPTYDGRYYVCTLHPDNTFDLRQSPEWIEAHKYSSAMEIFTGEVGMLHGTRFLESNLSPIYRPDTQNPALYMPMIFGKNAFAVIEPEGAGMRMIYKSFKEAGGPLEQFCTVGVKFSMATKILYPENMVVIECGSKEYGDTAADNYELDAA